MNASGSSTPSGPRQLAIELSASPPELLEKELRDLLAVRLRGVCVIFCVFWLCVLVFAAYWQWQESPWQDYACMVGLFACMIGLWVFLGLRPAMPLRQLRCLEWVVFAVMIVGIVWSQTRPLQVRFLSELTATQRRDALALLAGDHSFPWFALVVVYGTMIPNTARRCAVLVGVLSVIPFLVIIYVAKVHGLIGWDLLAVCLQDIGMYMVLGVAIALYGSHTYHALRQEARLARQLGEYQLKERLGRGGMGEVWLAEHRLLRRPCALKLIRADKAIDALHLTRFELEVQTLAKLTHWNVVEVYDFGRAHDGTFYFVMEYLPGLNLAELVDRHGPLPPDRVVHILRQACGALREAHACGLVHRDIKPSNLILTERGKVPDVVKLVDFGLVRPVVLEDDAAGGKITARGAIVGTPPYMSPEQIERPGEVDARSDLYSLGATAYFLLTGRPPFERTTIKQLFAAHVGEPVVPAAHLNPTVPEDLDRIVLRCLEKEPAQRFPDAASLEKALSGCACAGSWSVEQAEAWWREQAAESR